MGVTSFEYMQSPGWRLNKAGDSWMKDAPGMTLLAWKRRSGEGYSWALGGRWESGDADTLEGAMSRAEVEADKVMEASFIERYSLPGWQKGHGFSWFRALPNSYSVWVKGTLGDDLNPTTWEWSVQDFDGVARVGGSEVTKEAAMQRAEVEADKMMEERFSEVTRKQSVVLNQIRNFGVRKQGRFSPQVLSALVSRGFIVVDGEGNVTITPSGEAAILPALRGGQQDIFSEPGWKKVAWGLPELWTKDLGPGVRGHVEHFMADSWHWWVTIDGLRGRQHVARGATREEGMRNAMRSAEVEADHMMEQKFSEGWVKAWSSVIGKKEHWHRQLGNVTMNVRTEESGQAWDWFTWDSRGPTRAEGSGTEPTLEGAKRRAEVEADRILEDNYSEVEADRHMEAMFSENPTPAGWKPRNGDLTFEKIIGGRSPGTWKALLQVSELIDTTWQWTVVPANEPSATRSGEEPTLDRAVHRAEVEADAVMESRFSEKYTGFWRNIGPGLWEYPGPNGSLAWVDHLSGTTYIWGVQVQGEHGVDAQGQVSGGMEAARDRALVELDLAMERAFTDSRTSFHYAKCKVGQNAKRDGCEPLVKGSASNVSRARKRQGASGEDISKIQGGKAKGKAALASGKTRVKKARAKRKIKQRAAGKSKQGKHKNDPASSEKKIKASTPADPFGGVKMPGPGKPLNDEQQAAQKRASEMWNSKDPEVKASIVAHDKKKKEIKKVSKRKGVKRVLRRLRRSEGADVVSYAARFPGWVSSAPGQHERVKGNLRMEVGASGLGWEWRVYLGGVLKKSGDGGPFVEEALQRAEVEGDLLAETGGLRSQGFFVERVEYSAADVKAWLVRKLDDFGTGAVEIIAEKVAPLLIIGAGTGAIATALVAAGTPVDQALKLAVSINAAFGGLLSLDEGGEAPERFTDPATLAALASVPVAALGAIGIDGVLSVLATARDRGIRDAMHAIQATKGLPRRLATSAVFLAAVRAAMRVGFSESSGARFSEGSLQSEGGEAVKYDLTADIKGSVRAVLDAINPFRNDIQRDIDRRKREFEAMLIERHRRAQDKRMESGVLRSVQNAIDTAMQTLSGQLLKMQSELQDAESDLSGARDESAVQRADRRVKDLRRSHVNITERTRESLRSLRQRERSEYDRLMGLGFSDQFAESGWTHTGPLGGSEIWSHQDFT